MLKVRSKAASSHFSTGRRSAIPAVDESGVETAEFFLQSGSRSSFCADGLLASDRDEAREVAAQLLARGFQALGIFGGLMATGTFSQKLRGRVSSPMPAGAAGLIQCAFIFERGPSSCSPLANHNLRRHLDSHRENGYGIFRVRTLLFSIHCRACRWPLHRFC